MIDLKDRMKMQTLLESLNFVLKKKMHTFFYLQNIVLANIFHRWKNGKSKYGAKPIGMKMNSSKRKKHKESKQIVIFEW